jgi:hypothetical protein
MTVNDIKKEWPEVRPKARRRWGRLTEADLEAIEGDARRLVERLEVRYGFPRQIVLAELGHFLKSDLRH